jgi:hypothetical protein
MKSLIGKETLAGRRATFMNEHKHTESCGSTPEIDSLLSRLNDPGTKLTERQFCELRGKYFTVRHYTVPDCGHKIDVINEPTFRNCQYCWFTWLESHPELVKTADEAYIEHGAAFIDKLRGKKFRVMFTRFMATKLAMKKEMDERAAQEKNEQQSGDIQEGGSVRESDGQGERRDNYIPETGEVGKQACTLNSDESTNI